MKHLQEVEVGPNPQSPSIGEGNKSNAEDQGVMASYTDTSPMQRGQQTAVVTTAATTPNQVGNLMRKAPSMPKPKWHPPWKLYRVIAGHLGWVRCVTVEPGNEVRFC